MNDFFNSGIFKSGVGPTYGDTTPRNGDFFASEDHLRYNFEKPKGDFFASGDVLRYNSNPVKRRFDDNENGNENDNVDMYIDHRESRVQAPDRKRHKRRRSRSRSQKRTKRGFELPDHLKDDFDPNVLTVASLMSKMSREHVDLPAQRQAKSYYVNLYKSKLRDMQISYVQRMSAPASSVGVRFRMRHRHRYRNCGVPKTDVSDVNEATCVDATSNSGMPELDKYPMGGTYPPNSPQLIQLLQDACTIAGLDQNWATNAAIHALIAKESGGRIGIPNYTRTDLWPSLWEKMKSGDPSYRGNGGNQSRRDCIGLGQLCFDSGSVFRMLSDSSGAPALGNPLAEAVGLLRTIQVAYGTPEILLYGGTKPDGTYWGGHNSASGGASGFDGY
ncbi:hypothetical protein M427DRAFT_48504 [Gonapodya prolifera JEL478]|uniref:Uncharacterized protein n=1 Tax=Gonapodya prolifera (strain JEL478) TaxID=1344416 RepID=A0A139A0G6_GONPJ|nr:hypothetical protein M427DRAFT_48504 [Gonapodya prolifera JEL478]|eukprot:KXS10214.1 hypothetical protein M427DRAFT_48504 [Gonapodya prolifera JEL478]